jgi:serine/threonine-protein kinase
MNLPDVALQSSGHAFDDASLSTAERRLVKFVGPMARIFVRQAAAQAHDDRELYALLAERIDDAAERERFTRLAAGDASGSRTVATTGATRSGSNSAPRAATAATRARAPRPLDQPFIDRTTTRLAVYMGPIARVVARKAAQQARDADEFVRLVAEHLGTQERDAFVREVDRDA